MAKAYVLMSCNLGYEKPLISELKSIENVTEVHGTLGLYDIIAKLEADSDEKIKQTITEKIRKVGKIEAENHKELEKIITKKIRNLKFIRTTMTLNVVKEQE